MNAVLKRMVVYSAVVLMIVGCFAFATGAGAQDGNTSGLPGYEGPPFVVALVRAIATGGQSSVPDCSPFAITGYAMSKGSGSIHIWIVSCNDVVKALGYKPGDIVEVLCSNQQIENINVGDWVELVGFTARGMLVRVTDTVLPEPFSY